MIFFWVKDFSGNSARMKISALGAIVNKLGDILLGDFKNGVKQ
jgi:hypothetical protein